MSFLIDHTPAAVKRTYIAPLILAKIREYQYRHKYYTDKKRKHPARKQVVFMVDGRFNHGGLSDRLWGLISTYLVCKESGVEFKANWVWPFNLTTFLLPASYDWTIRPDELSYNRDEATPVFVNNNHNVKNQWRLLRRVLKHDRRQVHVYSPAHIDRDNFGKHFAELFKPAPVLENAIGQQMDEIGGEFVSITFRFQQLLGDFKEGNYPTLPADKQAELLKKSIEAVEEVRRRNPEVKKILVTSDSRRMLEQAARLPYVHIIPGKLVHMSYTDTNESDMNHLKAFLDFFMIGNAKKVYFAQCPGIYGSTFAHTASRLHKAPYEVIEIQTTAR